MATLSDTLLESLGRESIVPPERRRDYSVDGVAPEAAVLPSTVEDLVRVLSLARKEGRTVVPWGGGTQMALGNIPRGVDLVLATGSLDRVLFHEPADLVASVQAGVTLEAFQRQLAKVGQFLPIEAPIPSRATIGGILAANASGPQRLAHGTARDWLIGIRVANSSGQVTKSGGRVVKNVTGYDLNKLYIGSLGTLGVIVEATFKIAPLPSHKLSLVATYPSIASAVESAQRLRRQGPAPQALHLVNRQAMGGLQRLKENGGQQAAVLALYASRKAAVERKAEDAAGELGGHGAVERLSGEDSDSLWQEVTDLGWRPEGEPSTMVRLSTLPSLVGDFLAMAESLGGPAFRLGIVADVGFGLVRLLWWPEEAKKGPPAPTEETISQLREWAADRTGHVVVERCPLELKAKIDVWGDPPESITIMRRIKQQVDPQGILNPGRFVGRL